MTITDWTGFAGVAILLLAYFLSLFGRIPKDGLLYIVLNLAGASIACLASVLIDYLPFILLEGAWALVSAFALFTHLKR